MWQWLEVRDPRDDAAGGKRDGVLVERLAAALVEAGGTQRERSAEGAAEVVSLWQLAGVCAEQRARSGE